MLANTNGGTATITLVAAIGPLLTWGEIALIGNFYLGVLQGVIIVVWVWSLTWSNYRCGLCGCTTVVGAVMGGEGECGNVLDYCLVEL